MLDLNELPFGRMPGITAKVGGALAEAAGVCLESHGHAQGVALTVRGDRQGRHQVYWPQATPQAKRAWADEEEATEQGAAGVAALLAQEEVGYVVVAREPGRRL